MSIFVRRNRRPILIGTTIIVVLGLMVALFRITPPLTPILTQLTPTTLTQPAVLSTPQDLIALAGDRQVILSWIPVPGATTYNLYWAAGDDLSQTANQRITGVSSPYIHTGLTNLTTYSYMVTAVNEQGESMPSRPVSVIAVPPVNAMTATNLAESDNFLYTGSTPIQTGLDQKALVAGRIAVLRGRVMSRENKPLADVVITVVGHPEYGSTYTRQDGIFDIVVNGGGKLTVSYNKQGLLQAQRPVNVPWLEYTWLPDVVLIPADAQVTTIDLHNSNSMLAARGSVIADTHGSRQSTLLFPPGTTAEISLPNGQKQSLVNLSVRSTEYTVGSNGPATMPATLPPNSAYTYAIELSADEAQAAGAKDIRFSKPLIHYVENFLHFPVGENVPLGYYDRETATWVASDNGRIIQIVAIRNGIADLDVDGSGQAADPIQLAQLGIDEAERKQLANLYKSGQSLWRMPIQHFSAWDANWGWSPPKDATAPDQQDPDGDDPAECPIITNGSIIECQNQMLGQTIEIAGTPFSLNYRSDRVRGRQAAASLRIHLSSANIPASLKRIDLEVYVAGQRFTQSFSAQTNQTFTYTWNGKDVYGRFLLGRQQATVRIGYVYDGVYEKVERFGYNGNGIAITGDRTRQEVTLWQEQRRFLNVWDNRALALGGWSLNIHHIYDPTGQVLYPGDRPVRSSQTIQQMLTTIAGNGTAGSTGDGGPALQAELERVDGLVAEPDGSLFLAGANRIRRIMPSGIITTVAGSGTAGYSGDGGPAIQAELNGPSGIALGTGGSLFIADYWNNRIRRVGPDGIITTVAGSGLAGFSGDDGPATQAQLNGPQDVAIGQDGSLYIADKNNNRIRRVGPDGIITTVAGSSNTSCCQDGIPATQATLNGAEYIALGPDSSLYIVTENTIRRVGPDGMITRIVGISNLAGASGDGGLALPATLHGPAHIVIGPDGSLYIADRYNNRVRRVSPDGIITTVAGSGVEGNGGDSEQALRAQLAGPNALALGPDGSLYISQYADRRIRRLSTALAGLLNGEWAIPSDDGAELYLFDRAGHHQRTLNTLTGGLLYRFEYDLAGRLITITDGDGNITRIERDTTGIPLAIIAPHGQRTILKTDADGYLTSVVNPAGELIRLSYTNGGLLSSFTDPKDNLYRFSYDLLGRLTRDDDPAGGYSVLERTSIADGYQVTLHKPLGQQTISQVEQHVSDQERVVTMDDSGAQTAMNISRGISQTIVYPDKTVIIREEQTDPLFNGQVSVPKQTILSTPGGLKNTSIFTRAVTLSNPTNLLSLDKMTNTLTINGHQYTTNYNASVRKITTSTPTGRQSVYTIDSHGRIVMAQDGTLLPVSYSYDNQGRLSIITYGIAPNTRIYTFTYDSDGNLASIIDPLKHITRYEYDQTGRLTRQIMGDGQQVILYTYDINGLRTSITSPGGSQHMFEYTAVDQLKSYRAPQTGVGSKDTGYTYDEQRRLTRAVRPDGTSIEYTYNKAGYLTTTKSQNETISATYDPQSMHLTSIAADSGTLAYTYDGFLLTGLSWTGAISGNVNLSYMDDFTLRSMSVNGSQPTNFIYDPDSLLIQAGALTLNRDAFNGLIMGTKLANITTEYEYNGFGEMTGYRAISNNNDLLEVQLTRNELGYITGKTETVNGQTDTFRFEYDAVGRLINVQKNGTMYGHYEYDPNGNRLLYLNQGGSSKGSYDAQDHLIQYGGIAFTYTANGELASKTVAGITSKYTYDNFGNLKTIILADGTKLDYIYDGARRQIGKKVNDNLIQTFLYDNALHPVAELDGRNNIVSRFIYGSRNNVPDYIEREGKTYRIITDYLGSPRLVVDVTTGTIAQRLDYDEFGNVLQDSNPGFQPFGFAGGIYDHQTGLVKFGAREYDAQIGRWTTKDPIYFAGGDTNLYVYSGNNPLNFTDRLGLAANDLNCEYEQQTGNWTCTNADTGEEESNATGYSGHGEGLNNPSQENMPNVGPIPKGDYTVGSCYNGSKGKPQCGLTPDSNNNMYGRAGFLIHGDNASNNNTASNGCIILPKSARETLKDHRDKGGTVTLKVK